MKMSFSQLTLGLLLIMASTAQAQALLLDDQGRELHGRLLSKQGSWEIGLHSRDPQHRQPVMCSAIRHFGTENWLAYVMTAKQTHLDFSGYGTGAVGKRVPVRIYMDRPDPVTQHTAVLTGPAGVEWLRITESREEMGIEDGLMSGQKLFIESGKERWTYSLAGSGNALKAVFDCDAKYISR